MKNMDVFCYTNHELFLSQIFSVASYAKLHYISFFFLFFFFPSFSTTSEKLVGVVFLFEKLISSIQVVVHEN